MPKAVWNGTIVAESDATVVVEGNHYFPPEALSTENVAANELKTNCPWKGTASYYDVVVGGEVNSAAAWFYPEPPDAASHIKDHVAFGGGITVEA